MTLLREIAVEPIPPRTSFIDEDKLLTFGLQLPDELVDVALARADGAQIDDFGVVCVSNGCDRDGFFVDIHSDIKGGRLGHG
jgi:hypothetical protein